jgi:hypothetical protein
VQEYIAAASIFFNAHSIDCFAIIARVLDLVKPVMILIPEVSPPDRRVRTYGAFFSIEESG